MEDVKVGEYIRTDTKIGRVIKIKDNNKFYRYVVRFKNRTSNVAKDSIKIHSENLFDLIHDGDYVNGEKVYSINGNLCIASGGVKYLFENDKVESVVTEEQFESIKYEVENVLRGDV